MTLAAVEETSSEPALQLPVGSPGKVGLLDMDFAVVGETTKMVAHKQRVPYQVLRAMYYDLSEPNMAYTTVLSPTGGLLQGDRLTLGITVRSGASVHVTTAAATNVYTMKADHASLDEELLVEPHGYLEYIPDPIIPHKHARYVQNTRLVADPDGVLVYGETLLPGRIAMDDEIFQYDRLDIRVRALRPDGKLLFNDRLYIDPTQAAWSNAGRMGDYLIMCNLFCLVPAQLLGRLREAFTALPPPPKADAVVGFSELPHESGLLLRCLAKDTITASGLMGEWWRCTRQALRGTQPPETRKY